MRRTLVLSLAALVTAACNGGPAGPGEPQIDFTVTAPTTVNTKRVVDVEARITSAQGVQFPLMVVFEKANVGEPFFQVASYQLQGNQRTAVAGIPVLSDPRIRVTVRESSAAEISVSKTIQVDVLDFP